MKYFLIASLVLLNTLPVAATGPYAARRSPIVQAFEANKDAVVSITSAQVVRRRSDFFNIDPQLDEWLFGPRAQVQPSLGSGFVIDPRGYIVTNAHVVQAAVQIKIVMDDDSAYEASLIAVNEAVDMAVLKIDADRELTAVKLGYSDDLMIGETVLAVGNPFGYQQTLTDGIISAIHRDLDLGEDSALSDLIQISAPINPGNSGGPLLNINGEVIGINTAIRRAAQGIGFAIPVDRLRAELPAMLNLDHLYRMNLGLDVEDVHPQRDTQGNPITPGRTRITAVRPRSAADRAGIEPGDIITGIDSDPVEDALQYAFTVLERAEQSEISLQVQRDNRSRIVSLPLAVRPKPDGIQLAQDFFGLTLSTVKSRRANRSLIIVDAVELDSPADRAGIQTDDILRAVQGQALADTDDLGLLLELIPADTKIDFLFERIYTRGWFTQRQPYEVTLTTRAAQTPQSFLF